MKPHKSEPPFTLTGIRKPRVIAICALLLAGALEIAPAQFHNPGPTGQAVPSANGTSMVANPNAPAVYRGAQQGAGMIDTRAVDGAKLAYTDFRTAVVWGRAIYHNDDTYTESKQDSETNSLTQETKSANGVTLMRRLISLDTNGNPSEILIYDGRGQYRYRGQILYNRQGRFSEEQIFDTNNQLLRRTIQEYDATGRPLSLKVVDDLAKIPADLKLVITQSDGVVKDAKRAEQAYQEFLKEAKEVRPGQPDSGAASPPVAKEEPKKPGIFGRFFNKK